jgi:tRNA nucleotidyltransferase (CCA-adding enzyme)
MLWPVNMSLKEFQLDRILEQSPNIQRAISRVADGIRSIMPVAEYGGSIPRVLLVGGFVRDALLGTVSKDIDLEVYGVTAEKLESLVSDLFPGKMNVVGRSFGILKVFLEDGIDLDIALPRRESKHGTGHTGFLVAGDPAMSVEEALHRRDFTINAIAVDVSTGELIDPCGGREDLENKTLRIVNASTFQDDPLRVYRAIQFVARFDLTVEKETLELLRFMVERGDLKELSKERVTEEMKKLLLKAERPSIGFSLMCDLGIIERDYPELRALIGTEQEKEWHPEGDVWIHTLMVIDAAAKIIRRSSVIPTEESLRPAYRQAGERRNPFSQNEKLQIMLGAVCHDLGKPATTAFVDGRIRSRGHESAGKEPTHTLLERWTFGDDALKSSLTIAEEHLKPALLYRAKEKGEISDEQYVNAVRRLLKRIAPLSWEVFLAAAEADSRGRAFPSAEIDSHLPGEMMREVIAHENLDGDAMKPLLQGKDLKSFGIAEGPKMGKIIADIEAARDRGEIKTKEEAIEWLKKNV